MSTSVAAIASASKPLPGRRYDRVFFPIMGAIILVTVFIGFAKTYYLAGMIHAPLPSWIVHVHGAIFSSWVVLFIVQIGLVSARRVDLHKKLGLLGFGLACLMVLFGLLAARDSLLRGMSGFPGMDPRSFFVIPVGDMFIFSPLVYFGYALRRDPAAHKLIMLIATVGLLDAAVARWPFHITQTNHLVFNLANFAVLIFLIAYDLWSTHKVYRATVFGSLFVVILENIKVPIGMTHAWIRFADMVLGKF
jgi:hypothetical protein